MLKIWKQAWRKDDKSAPADSSRGSNQEAPLRRDDNEESSQGPVVVIPPMADAGVSGAGLPSALPTGSKREQSVESESEAPPKKRPRASKYAYVGDTLLSTPPPEHPAEVVVLYERPAKLSFTPLYRQLRQVDKDEVYLRRHFSASRYALVDLGSCASDLLWRRALSDIESSVASIYDEDVETEESMTLLEARDIVRNWDFTMPNLDPSSRGFNVTPKFLKLVQILKACQPYGDSFRAIVFVRRRATALVMVELLRTLDVGDLRPQAVVGKGSFSDSVAQQDLFNSFELGTYNIIVATKSSEDLEIPPATVVVRYDLFDSQVSYANARTRARGPEHYLVHMLQRGDDVQRRRLTQVTTLDNAMQSWMDKVISSPLGAIPPSTLHETHDPYLSDSEDEDESDPYIRDPTTSGRLRLQDATGTIYRFVSSLELPTHLSHRAPLYEYREVGPGTHSVYPTYICTVNLPPGPPIRRVSGPPSPSRSSARRGACFEMCKELFNRGILDYRLFPRPPNTTKPKRRVPDPMGYLDADDDHGYSALPPKGTGQNKVNGTRCYPRRQPEFWTNSLEVQTNRFFPTIISVQGLDTHAPMLILTRLPLPDLSSFKLFHTGVSTVVDLQRGAPLEVDDTQLQHLYLYTIRVCRSIVNKPFVCQRDRMPYFFAPLSSSWTNMTTPNDDRWRLSDVASHIPWDLVKVAAERWVVGLKYEDLESTTAGAIIQDRWVEFTRRYFTVKVRRDLTPLSMPEDSPREAAYGNFEEYCKARRNGFEGLKTYDQPMIEVERVPPVLNRLDPGSKPLPESLKAPAKYLIPELCAQFTIPANTFRTALLLPSITRRIDDFLIVKELNAMLFDHSIHEHHLFAAISAPSVGAEFDYERLELLGDAYLKYLSSIYLFVTNPSQHEGALHSARLRIISNKALLLNADSAGLPPFIQSKPFVSKVWQPPNFNVLPPPQSKKVQEEVAEEDVNPGLEEAMEIDEQATAGSSRRTPEATEVAETETEQATAEAAAAPADSAVPSNEAQETSAPDDTPAQDGADKTDAAKPPKRSKRKRQQEERNIQWLGDKAVADVAEAIIGAAYVTGGREIALKASKALNIAVPSVDRWSDFGRKALAPPPDVTAQLKPGTVEAVEAILGRKFQRPHLLAQALTHASIQGYEMTCYERLEFIGDAILDFLVIRHIYDRDTQLSPGALTLLKGAMVSNSALAAICIYAGLHEHLMFESFNLANNIKAYAEALKIKQNEEYELAAQEGRSPGQYWLETEPPKAISDVVESVIGAIYISDDFNPDGAQSFFDRVLKPFYDKHITLRTISHHPTKILFELFQAEGCQHFQIVKQTKTGDQQSTRCDVIVHDVILARAIDTTSTLAQKRASLLALDALEGDAEFMARTCDCRAQSQAKKAQKKALKHVQSAFGEEDEEVMAVEDFLAGDAQPAES
ncbi:ribonuclease III [Artomyces pyxidatus]|uniref:Ribonuclease III n=1 Tax=Artomyces pyxidatus TaxID=48021 RepID=A0ACB8TKY2_9AGAM|nr:ribonuclease III [Artomyces pyxidatus]